MNMNVYAIETQMLQRRSEIEKAALTEWQWGTEKKKVSLFSGFASKLRVAKEKAQVQTTPAFCCC